jgi:hypothetical protein
VNGAAHVPAISVKAVSKYHHLKREKGQWQSWVGKQFLKVKLKSCLDSEDEK